MALTANGKRPQQKLWALSVCEKMVKSFGYEGLKA
jgi:hypothetical protein